MSKNAILYSAGDNLPYWPVTQPSREAYAARLGIPFVVIPQRTKGNRQWVIFDAMAATPLDSFGAWVDADILISATATNIFRYGKSLMIAEPPQPHRVNPTWQAVHGKYGVPNCRPYVITGLVVWSGEVGRKIAAWVAEKELAGKLPSGWGDQEVMVLAIWELDLPTHYFPTPMHRAMKDPTHLGSTEFVHFGGGQGNPQKKIIPLRKLRRAMEARDGNI